MKECGCKRMWVWDVGEREVERLLEVGALNAMGNYGLHRAGFI